MIYRKFRKRKKSYLKMSVEELNQCLVHFQSRLVEIQKELDSYLPKYVEIQKKEDELRTLKPEPTQIKKAVYEKLSSLRKFFSDPDDPPLDKSEKMHLRDIHDKIYSLEEWLYDNSTSKIRYMHLIEELQATEKSIETVKRSIIVVSKRNEKKAKNRAIIASYFGKSREVAQSVRKQIKDQLKVYKNCPYCFGELGDRPHCDHIYPIARGGLSSPENMVYICAKCNQDKKDYTLREFIMRNKLDRDKIEKNLQHLKKRF